MNLLGRILQEIDERGGITLGDYMLHALADPDEGYYMQQMPLGVEGDFVTSPEISQVFGELLGVWVAECWQVQGRPKADVVEVGPGLGTLMDDFLRATKHVPGFHEAIDVHMVETSPKLRKHQRYALGDRHPRIRWHEQVPQGEKPLFILGNEFFDALPIEQYIAVEGGFRQRMVVRGEEDDTLAFGLGEELHAKLPLRYPSIGRGELDEGEIVEVSPVSQEVLRPIAARIARHGGAALFIDYGYEHPQDSAPLVGDTFQAVRKHRFHDVLEAPGSADLTAHVDFSTLAQVAVNTGAYVPPVLSQREFLLRMGGELRMTQLERNARSELVRDNIRKGFARLIDPQEMGELFRVMAVMPAGIPAPVFTNKEEA